MAQLATNPKIVNINQIRQQPEPASETTWDDITLHVVNIDKVTAMILEDYRCNFQPETVKACTVIHDLCVKMRRLQEAQRKGFDRTANGGIGHMASKLVPNTLDAVAWPGVPNIWLDSVRLSAEKIAKLAGERQRTH